MRVALASLHPRAFSGQINSLLALGRALTRSGDDVRMFTATLSNGSTPSRVPDVLRYAGSALRVVGDIAKGVGDADVVHLNLPTPGFTLLADWLADRINVPLVVGYEAPLISRELVGSVANEALRDPLFYLPRLLVNNRLVARAARYRAAAYVVSSNYQRAQLKGLGTGATVAVIPNLIDDLEDGAPDPALARQRLGLTESGPLVGYVGHLHPVKGVETLVRSLRALKVRSPGAKLVLAWSGLGDQSALTRLAAQLGGDDHVIWLGKTNRSDFLRAIDVLALPYRFPLGQNAFPNVLLEAQGFGVPLVATRIPIVAEACQPAGAALLVPPGEPAHLAWAISCLLEDEARRAVMVRRQMRSFAERFAPDVLVRRYRSLYSQVVDGKTPTVDEVTSPATEDLVGAYRAA